MSSATALADAGVQAVAAGKYAEGVEKLTKALNERPAPLWHLERSKAYLRTSQIGLALYDAEMALRIAYDRANRDQMMQAQIRRAVALFRMGRFADADVCAFWAIRLSEGARALEEDGQQKKVDSNGDYLVCLKEVQNEAKPTPGEGLNAAMLSAGARSQESSLKNQAFSWRVQALTQIENLPAGHDGRKLHTLAKYPELSEIETSKKARHESSDGIADKDTSIIGGEGSSGNTANAASGRDAWEKLWAQYIALYTKYEIRCSFYQTDTSLTIDLFLKNLTSSQVTIDSESQAIKLSPVEGASLGGYNGPIVLLLFGQIKPESTKYNIKSMKIELVLQKQRAGKWPNLRRDNADIVDNLSISPSQGVSFGQFFDFVTTLGYNNTTELELPSHDSDPSAWYTALLQKLRSDISTKQESLSTFDAHQSVSHNSAPGSQSKNEAEMEGSAGVLPTRKQENVAPAYPTSSKKGPKNWDNIDEDDGDDKDDDKNGDVNDFFRQIYKDADPDTRRAMMKSFQESNGTSLSTSWADAKSKTYKTQPPDGVEAKKWD
ncbi:putative cs domain-containing protein [Rosellinia necatrix]|uniref:Putative cs domain-containing protein n=1 Tax=Rosellinia necatrix TaxID=77044 RepID=A0A1W2TSC1_ROSNE|nr:putative cs domain-containing protein [Rosellinia necatrix]